MLDIKWVRDNPDLLDAALAARGAEPVAARLLSLDDRRRAVVQRLQELQETRNARSKEIGKAKAAKDEARAAALMEEVARLKADLSAAEEDERAATEALEAALATVPNPPLPDVPVGPDEGANMEVRRIGTPRTPEGAREHFELGEALGWMDFEAAARMSGARFVALSGPLARLERALGQFMLDLHVREHGYVEVSPPLLVRSEAVFGTAQLPKFAEDLFATTDERWLVPTAEVPLTNLVREQTLAEADLPIRVTALTPCFRSEAGSAGRDTRGMLRQHQFQKVELVSIAHPDRSLEELERMVGCAEEVLRRLGLAWRVVTLSTGDMGFASAKTYDIEVWLPGQGQYREISSCSVCTDFQARRMRARFRPDGGGALRHVHTLNGSGVAVGRALIAVMETYQRPDGSIEVPAALVPYMGGVEAIRRKGG